MAEFGRILLTGCNGQVGYELQRTLAPLGNVIALGRDHLDLTDVDALRHTIQNIKPDLIVNPAAFTAVDSAESEPKLAYSINAIAPGVIAEQAAKIGALFIHYSTDYVYDGTKSGAYVETDQTNPLSVYGKSKLAGERAIYTVGVPHLILRLGWVYSARGKNFLRTIIRLAQKSDKLRVVTDQLGAPTASYAIAQATAEALTQWHESKSGIYHMACAGQTSWHGFAQQILEDYALYSASRGWPPLECHAEDVTAITTHDYSTPASRPMNSLLDNSKLMHSFNLELPPWQNALANVIAGLELD